jgi:hypothetical protein
MSIKDLSQIDFWREKCLTDLYFLCRVVLQTLEDPTNGFKDMYKPTHKIITQFVQKYGTLPEQNLVVLCPRGWLKSYIISVGFIVQIILNGLVNSNRKGETILLSNATLSNAKMFLKKIKYNFEHNELLRDLFPEIPRDPEKQAGRWTLEEIELKNTLVETGSVEGNLVSKHYSLLINDDLVNKENCSTPEQINKTIDWWKLSRSLLESRGTEIIIGTRYDNDDLYGYLLNQFFGFTIETYNEHRNKPIIETHKDNYHYLRISCWEDPVNEKGSTFPILFPESKLKKIKEQQAEFFFGQYLNDPISDTTAIFKRSWIQHWRRGELPEIRNTYMLIDPSGKETAGSDKTGMVVIDAGADKNLYVIYAKSNKETDLKAVEQMINLASLYQPIYIGIEETKYEVYRDLCSFLLPQLIRQGKLPKGSEAYAKCIPNILFPLKPKNRPKELRVKNLTGWFESGKILLPPIGYEDLLNEILFFGRTRYDDIVDALAYILDCVVFPNPAEPKKQYITSYDANSFAERERRFWESEGWNKPTNLLGDDLE